VTPDLDLELGATLRGLRLVRGLGLSEVARRSGASKAALSAWENGTRRPRGPALARLLDALEADTRSKARLLRLAEPQNARMVLADSPLGASVNVGVVLRVMRERRGIAQADLARQLGVAQATVSRWETGEGVPSTETLHALGFALGATAEETLALASAQGEGDAGLPDDVDAVVARIWEGPGFHPLRELLLLGWEAELGRRASWDNRWDPGLAAVLSARACLLVGEVRFIEVPPLVQRAIRLAGTTEARTQAVPAVGSLDHAYRNLRRSDVETTEMAEAWAARLPDSPQRAWMLRQRGLASMRAGKIAEGLEWIERSSDVELQARPDHPEPWSHRAEMLADAYLEAGQPRSAADVLGGRRERHFPPSVFVRIEHANGRTVTDAEMAWLRYCALSSGWSQTRLQLARIERRQTRLGGALPETPEPLPNGVASEDPPTEDRLWAAVLRERPVQGG